MICIRRSCAIAFAVIIIVLAVLVVVVVTQTPIGQATGNIFDDIFDNMVGPVPITTACQVNKDGTGCASVGATCSIVSGGGKDIGTGKCVSSNDELGAGSCYCEA